ncbi:zinc finger protein 271-like isoform X2 [Leguminivora glycinivorella]|uniref:zinc finger protein 271-like isoform X2 n=1 Tax=Leguminivora glycinivorella TaxID=1035111 RepID=UPI00200CBC79|nr:zinc finger protein 271-like isoform X2 [Leguminivora glycinivorella]
MDVMNACRCCLRRPADKDLMRPYKHLGKTEIYAEMLKECFDLHLWVSESIFSGICSTCVGRLREASDFKLQVQLSQTELLAELQACKLEEKLPKDECLTDENGLSEASDAPVSSSMLKRESSPEWRPRPLPRPRPFQCHDCRRRFTLKKDISRHIQYNCTQGPLASKNRNITRYTCARCPYSTKNKRSLYFHEFRHVGQKPYQCDRCDYKTTRKADFERHQSIHTGDKPFECDSCGYKCIQKHTLLIHKRIHTGEKPYACDYCDVRFSRIQTLRRHQRRRHQLQLKTLCTYGFQTNDTPW